MMIKPQTSGWMRLAYGAVLPILAVLMFACNPAREQQEPEPVPDTFQIATETDAPKTVTVTKADVSDEEAVPFSLLEVKPTFNGENANAFSEWVNSHLKYPEDAKAAGEQGRVTLQFTIGTDGVVSNVKILRGVSESLDAEALRVVSSSPDWGPGKVNGKPVPVTFTFPVVFKLK